MADDSVSTRRLLEIMGANFLASAFVSLPFGLGIYYFVLVNTPFGFSLEVVAMTWIGWSVSWGLFSVGRAWQKNRSQVAYPEPMRTLLGKIGLNGQTEYFVDLLYFPGTHVPDCRQTRPVTPEFLR